jgi:hypothetical protein
MVKKSCKCKCLKSSQKKRRQTADEAYREIQEKQDVREREMWAQAIRDRQDKLNKEWEAKQRDLI